MRVIKGNRRLPTGYLCQKQMLQVEEAAPTKEAGEAVFVVLLAETGATSKNSARF